MKARSIFIFERMKPEKPKAFALALAAWFYGPMLTILILLISERSAVGTNFTEYFSTKKRFVLQTPTITAVGLLVYNAKY